VQRSEPRRTRRNRWAWALARIGAVRDGLPQLRRHTPPMARERSRVLVSC
jgi:hypothetical protein